jgi:hypothetical protein
VEQLLSVNFPRFYRLVVNAHIPLVPPPPTSTLTTSAGNGSIALNPPGGVYTTGMVVSVTANANPGFTFSHWSGDLTGSVNPTSLTMNGNQSVTANFAAVANYTLTTSATNGSITLNPAGGVYSPGMVVTVTANPNSGYAFTNWSGNLSGSMNPTNITMNGNKSVTANFVSVPTYTLTTSAANGSITLNPPGGLYNAGTVVTLTAHPNSGYWFTNWSGALSGSVSPTSLTMNGNKSVTANFNVLPPGSQIVLFVVGDANNLGSSDLAIRSRLQNNGYFVQTVSDELATIGDADGKALLIISSTISAAQVNSKFQGVAVPVVNWETGLQDDFGFAASSGNAGSQTNLNIINPSHPLAAGLPSGIRTVATAAGDFSWGEPGGNPIIIARLSDGSHPCLYAYEAGATMATGTAPARRVHLFLQNTTFASLNAAGLSLFDAAVSWAVD